MTARFLREAQSELEEAVEFYDGRQPGLGLGFSLEVEATIRRVLGRPTAWSRVGRKGARRCRVHRFAYCVIYAIEGGEVVIVAIMHHQMKPGYWRTRLK